MYAERVFSVPAAAGQAQVVFAFHYQSPGNQRFWAVDDVKVTGSAVLCDPCDCGLRNFTVNYDPSTNKVNGTFASLHARATRDLTAGLPKTLWPRGTVENPCAARRLLFACPVARTLLGGDPGRVHCAWVCEGATDWLTAAMLVGQGSGGEVRAETAVFGAANGGFEALAEVQWPDDDFEVWCFVDDDEAGTRYAATIAASICRPLRRLHPSRLAPCPREGG
jgi:hypothetical protein